MSSSREEVALAVVFARALRSILALTVGRDGRSRPSTEELTSFSSPDDAPLALFRLLQFSVLPHLFGESTGSALYAASKRFSRELEIKSLQALKAWFSKMQLGELEIDLDNEHVFVRLHGCLSCRELSAGGTPLCDFERGLVDGVLERITGMAVITRETKCRGLGDAVCEFEGYAGGGTDYCYSDAGGRRSALQRRLLTQLADQAEVALDNVRLAERLKEREIYDSLTGLFNFRHLREHACYELVRAERFGRKIAFAIIDIDGFHSVGKLAGREGCDEVLCHWAAALTAQLRSSDFICRYADNQFLLVLPETAGEQVELVLRRILSFMKGFTISTGGHTFALAASAGVTIFPEDGSELEELLAKAAAVLYTVEKKGNGGIAFSSGSTNV